MKPDKKWGIQYAHKSDAFSGTTQWTAEARELIACLPHTGVVLDFACNTGRFIEMAMQERPAVTFIGLDLNEYALSIARKRVPNANFITSLHSVPDEQVSMVVCMHALPQLQYPAQELQEIWRVLARGGLVGFVLHNKFNDWMYAIKNLFTGYRHDVTISYNYSLNDVNRLMKDSGFLTIRSGLEGKPPIRGCSIVKPRIVYYGRKRNA